MRRLLSPRFFLRALTLCVLAALAAARAARADPIPASVQIAVPRLSLHRINENDARAAIAVLATEIGRKYGYDFHASLSLYDDAATLPTALRAGRLQMALLSAWDYFAQGLEGTMDATLITVASGRPAHACLLLVRHDRHLDSLSALRGRPVRILLNSASPLGPAWLRTLLLDQHLGPPENFFSSVESVDRPSAAILHVFFGQSDACVVDDAAYGTMVELNPAIARELTPLAHSAPLANSLLCFARTGWEPAGLRADLIRALTEFDRSAPGRQVLTLFKYDRLQHCDPALLHSVRDLHRRYLQLASPSGL